MEWLFYVIAAIVGIAVGTCIGYYYRKNAAEKKIGRTEAYAKQLRIGVSA